MKRAPFFLVAAGCLLAALGLCVNYPIAPIWVTAAFCIWTLIAYARPEWWLIVIPALLPITGFASWTGWLTFEELDMLVLSAAAGGYARLALSNHPGRRHHASGLAGSSQQGADQDHRFSPNSAGSSTEGRHSTRRRRHKSSAHALSVIPILLIGLFLISSAIALYRGLDAHDSAWLGWWHGYHDPLNSLRLGKSFALAVLLIPLITNACRRLDTLPFEHFATGAVLGLSGAAICVIWERMAFTGLLDFSTDYRATGMFWEMHVGGAALDGFLALTFPFAIWALLRSHSIPRQTAALVVLALAAYACLTTFSRGLYAGVAASLIVMAFLRFRQHPWQRSAVRPPLPIILVLLAVAIVVCVLAFRSGGYRTLAAIFAALAVASSQTEIARRATLSQWVVALGMGVILGAVSYAAAPLIPKGPYVLFAIAVAASIGLAMRKAWAESDWFRSVSLSGYIWVLISATLVALHWGGENAWRDAAVAVVIVLAISVWNARSIRPLLPGMLQHQGIVVGSFALIAATVAVLSGGAYMEGRFATSKSDFHDRIQHWQHGIGLMDADDWILGKGLGRFPESYFYGVPDAVFPGNYSLVNTAGNAHVSLSGPRHLLDFHEFFRLSQRVSLEPGGVYTAIFDARAEQGARVHVETCEKHLLYPGLCTIGKAVLPPSASGWQHITIPLNGTGHSRGAWYAPRIAFFSIAVEDRGRVIHIDNVSLINPNGKNLIGNGDFHQGMARWFTTSDRYHLPWHIKNLLLNVLFDQGTLGLVLFVLLVAGALWRLVLGRASLHPMAPFLAASLTGFIVVGAFDSLLDVPRVAFLFYLILFLGLMLRQSAPQAKATE